jgi:hypothetical protein
MIVFFEILQLQVLLWIGREQASGFTLIVMRILIPIQFFKPGVVID